MTLLRKAALFGLLSARSGVAYFAQVNNAHLEFAATGPLDGRADDGGGLWSILEGALARHAPLGLASPQIMARFEEWGAEFGREYASLEEKGRRLLIWLENHVLIETHNGHGRSFTMGHNEFSDLTHAEFRERMRLGEFTPSLQRRRDREFNFLEFREEAAEEGAAAATPRLRGAGEDAATAAGRRLPAAGEGQDWHAAGFMGPVRSQGICGACWAFSAAGAIESAMAIDKFNDMSPAEQAQLMDRIKAKEADSADGLGLMSDMGLFGLMGAVPLSEQNMIDCDTLHEKGCDGGLMMDAFEEEEVKKGICSEADYPYLATQGTCAASDCTPVPGSIVKDKFDIIPRKNAALVQGLDIKPVTAAMVATDPALQFYKSGIYAVEGCGKVTKERGDKECEMVYEGQDVCFPDVNHGVLVVGYGRDEAVRGDLKTYFKVKNSWGAGWGEDGYFRLARYETDKTDPLDNWGECAILSLLSFPIME